jgi:hypothetical protein
MKSLSGGSEVDRSPGATLVEAHEEFAQHIEASHRRMRSLSILTVILGGFLGLSYAFQILYPFATGERVITVNLTDPILLALEAALLFATAALVLVAALDYQFATRQGRIVKGARAAEKELEKKLLSENI